VGRTTKVGEGLVTHGDLRYRPGHERNTPVALIVWIGTTWNLMNLGQSGCLERVRGRAAMLSSWDNNNSNNPRCGTDPLRGAW
jgi:hypothetical protein